MDESDIASQAAIGITRIMNYDNIAIVIMMVCLSFSGIFNMIQARILFWVLTKNNKTLSDLNTTVAILNERIGHES